MRFHRGPRRIRIPNKLAAATALVLLVTMYTGMDNSNFTESTQVATQENETSVSREARQLATDTVAAAARPAVKVSLMLFRPN